MYYVYVLRSQNFNWRYVGLTDDLHRRLSEHNNGWVSKTKIYKPFTLVYVEIVGTRIEARKFEKYFKAGFGREILDEIEERSV